MQISHLTILAFVAGLGLAAPTAKVDTRAAQDAAESLTSAGNILPRQVTIEWCTASCDCAKVPKAERFQCYTNANCEECKRRGWDPKDARL